MTIPSTGSFSLEHYGYNLTHLAQEGIFSPLTGYKAWVSRIFDILLRKKETNRRYNPVLIDTTNMRMWPIALEVVRRLAIGEAATPLPSLKVIAPNFATLCHASLLTARQEITRAASKEELLSLLSWPPADSWSASEIVLPRFKSFLTAIHRSEDQILLLLNDVHRLVGGEPQPYAIDMANELVPALARRQIQFLGLSTLAPFRQYIERHAAIQVRVQPIMIQSDEEVKE